MQAPASAPSVPLAASGGFGRGARLRQPGCVEKPIRLSPARRANHAASRAVAGKHPILLGLLTMGPAAAASDDGQPPLGRPVYLALGDSVAAGVGASDPAVTGYVPRLYDLLRDEPSCQLLGRPGCAAWPWTTWPWAGPPRPRCSRTSCRGRGARPATGDGNPRNDVLVVTIDIGGNDVFSVVPSCTAGPTPSVWG